MSPKQGLYRLAFAGENYLLLARALRAARLVRRHLAGSGPSPRLAASLRAVAPLYQPPQAGWRLSDAAKIARAASLVVRVPTPWGRCVHRSLIAYHLLNGYGFPARLHFGIRKGEADADDLGRDGHAWVSLLAEPDRPFAEADDPRLQYKIIYSAPLP